MSGENTVHLSGISKSFVGREGVLVPALENIDLEVREGTITCLVGPTGCGKTTLLRLAAGLDEPDTGRIGGPGSRGGCGGGVGYLSQSHSLLPWLTVRQNTELPLRLAKESDPQRSARSQQILQSLGLAQFADLYPYELSGGMQQRTGIGRLLASRTRVWLMDEPFSALDERTRHRLQDLLIEINREEGITILFVTHSIDEAVYLADEVHVLSLAPGRIVKTLSVDNERPRNRLAKEFGEYMEEVRRAIEEVIG